MGSCVHSDEPFGNSVFSDVFPVVLCRYYLDLRLNIFLTYEYQMEIVPVGYY